MDDKILTSWNGLMIWTMAKAAAAVGRKEFLEAALQAEEFIWKNLHQGNGGLLARWRQGEAKYAGTLEDYAFFPWVCWNALTRQVTQNTSRKLCWWQSN